MNNKFFNSTQMIVAIFIMAAVFSISPAQAAPVPQSPNFPAEATVLRTSNLRAGPGTSYSVVGQAQAGKLIRIASCNDPCSWYQLENGEWIAAFLVELSAASVATAVVPSTSTARPTPTVTSTPTSAPAEPITVVTWNVESGGADSTVISQQIADFQEVDLWGLSEVNSPRDGRLYDAAAEVGEDGAFDSVVSSSGGGDRLLAIYNTSRFDKFSHWEVDAINTTGNARAALVLHLRENVSGQELLFMVNHLYRSRDNERREQARLLNQWASEQTLPVIAVGDYNFDWSVRNGERDHDIGYDYLVGGGVFRWVQPSNLVTTQCSGWPCRYNSVLDFIFAAGEAQQWPATSEIIVRAGDFPDDETTSDHRPAMARFWLSGTPASALLTSTNVSATAIVETPVRATVAPTAASTPTATATTRPTVVSRPAANRTANLRGGPGINYARVGSVSNGEFLRIVGQNQAGDWYQLDNDAWIAAFLVDGAPRSVSVVPTPEVPTPTALPPTATPAPVQAAAIQPSGSPNVVIQFIFYDGDVYQVESDEYAVIANTGTAAINIGGWRLNAGAPGQDFRFPSVNLEPGQRVRVYTDEVHPESGGLSFRNGQAIWRNKGDCGYLYDGSGVQVDEYCYE